MSSLRQSAFILLFVSVLLSHARPLWADTAPRVQESTDRIMAELMSPYCPGRLLRDCPSGQALQLKEKIVLRLEAGEEEQVIKEDLIATFGEEMRAAPRVAGFGLVAWLAPSLFLLLGGVLIILWLRSRSNQENELAAVPPLTPDAEERLSRLVDQQKRS